MCSKILLVAILKFLIVSAELITLIKDNELKCVLTEESVNLPVTVKNQDCLRFKSKRTLLKLEDESDWKVSQNIEMFELKYDIRLAGIEPHHTNSFQLKNNTFFMCVGQSTAVDILNESHESLSKFEIKKKISDDQSCEWRLCKTFHIKKSTVVLQSCGNYSNTFDESNTKFWIKLAEPPYFYIPQYYYSNKINEGNTSISLNSSDCVSMFVSVDEGCILEIYINNSVTQIEGFNRNGRLKTWKLQEIPTNGAKIMTINRIRKESNKSEGFWAIYKIQECHPNNIEIITTTCKNITNETRCEPYNKETKVSSRIWNKPYYLANKSCEQILGSTYKHCENHKICFGDKCHCAWGYEGSNCNETCKGTNYGLDCQEIYFRLPFISKNSNIRVDVYLNLTHIRISWLFPKDSLHFVEYKCQSKFCNITETKTVEVAIKNKIHVKNQAFESCEVTFLTQNKSLIEKINFEIKANFPIQDIELPDLEIDFSGISLKFNECKNFLGALIFFIQYKCQNKWCNNKTESFLLDLNKSYTKSFKINRSLELDATYRFIVKAIRQGENQYRVFEKECKPGEPYPLRDLSLYGSDSQNINIKWMEPYPLTGSIEKYYFSFNKEDDKSNSKFEKIDASKCILWDSFICGHLPRPDNLNSNFTIYVFYKYFGVSDISDSTKLIISKLDNFTYAPENIRVMCSKGNASEIVLQWEHPSYIYGRFNVFNITLKYKTNEEYVIKRIEGYQKKYNQTILINENEDYEIEIAVANGTSEAATVTVFGKSFNNLHLCYLHKQIYYLSAPKNDETCKMIKDEFGLHCASCESNEDSYFCEYTSECSTKINRNSQSRLLITTGPFTTANHFNKKEKETKNRDKVWSNYLKTKIATLSGIVVILIVTALILLFIFFKRKRRIRNNKSTKAITIFEAISREELNSLVAEALQNSNTTLPRPTKLSNTLNKEELSSLPEATINKEKKLNSNKNKTSGAVHCDGFESFELKSLGKKVPSKSESEDEGHLPGADNNFTKIQTNILESYLKQALLERQSKLINQFCALPCKTNASSFHALQSRNKNKNKDQKHIPYDYNRVVLRPLEGLGKDDYINASYIEGIENPKAYIATQGPKFCTIRDFWRMIWQEKIRTIVMVANFIEEKKRKCAEYFPSILGTEFECGEIFIKLLSEENYEYHVTRFLSVKYKGHKRQIQHFQLKWSPDDSTPFFPNMVVPLVRKISSIREQSLSPIVVHCSSGVNRTGTLILCDLAFQMAKKEKCVDFYNILKRLREQRPYMIPSKKQYLLAHLIVLECLMEEENVFKKSLKENMNKEVLTKQLLYLDRLSWHNAIIDGWMPREQNQITDSYYRVDGYMHCEKFLTTEIPDTKKLNSFWKCIITKSINVIVILQKEKETMWPFHRENPRTIISVEEKNVIETWYSIVIKLQIIVYHLQAKTIIYENTVHCFKIKCDNPLESESTKEMLCILEDIKKFSLDQENKRPALIICNDGITMCGLYTSLSYIIEKYQQEIEIDICNALQMVRKSGAPFIKTTEELEFLYKVMLKYLTKFDKYSHIM